MKAINPEMIVLARESRGLTQKELAENIDITQGALSKIEKGLQTPLMENLEKIAFKLNYPLSFFEQSNKVFSFFPLIASKRVTLLN